MGTNNHTFDKRKTTEQFIHDAKTVHGDRYCYSQVQYLGNKIPVTITCSLHGNFDQRPLNHIKDRQGCPRCGLLSITDKSTSTIAYFIEKAQAIHDKKYNYGLIKSAFGRNKIEIICPKHGIFAQQAQAHLQGQGCPPCSRELRFGIYNWKTFAEQPYRKETPSVIYFIKFEKDLESFCKVGITAAHTDDPRRRFAGKKKAGYTLTTLFQHHTSLYQAWTVERKFITEHTNFRYTPRDYFAGHTECFIFTPNQIQKALEYLHENI